MPAINSLVSTEDHVLPRRLLSDIDVSVSRVSTGASVKVSEPVYFYHQLQQLAMFCNYAINDKRQRGIACFCRCPLAILAWI